VEEADRLAKQYGARFEPPALLREMAKTNQSFYERFGSKKTAWRFFPRLRGKWIARSARRRGRLKAGACEPPQSRFA
jgi:hypothetical protein